MSAQHPQHEARAARTGAGTDVHDIRALTDTGAIRLPRPDQAPASGGQRTTRPAER